MRALGGLVIKEGTGAGEEIIRPRQEGGVRASVHRRELGARNQCCQRLGGAKRHEWVSGAMDEQGGATYVWCISSQVDIAQPTQAGGEYRAVRTRVGKAEQVGRDAFGLGIAPVKATDKPGQHGLGTCSG